jgi:hypothetical protein
VRVSFSLRRNLENTLLWSRVSDQIHEAETRIDWNSSAFTATDHLFYTLLTTITRVTSNTTPIPPDIVVENIESNAKPLRLSGVNLVERRKYLAQRLAHLEVKAVLEGEDPCMTNYYSLDWNNIPKLYSRHAETDDRSSTDVKIAGIMARTTQLIRMYLHFFPV